MQNSKSCSLNWFVLNEVKYQGCQIFQSGCTENVFTAGLLNKFIVGNDCYIIWYWSQGLFLKLKLILINTKIALFVHTIAVIY